MSTPLNPSEMGRRGGSKGTAAQALARRRNILRALAKLHPNSPRIAQELQRVQMEEAKARQHPPATKQGLEERVEKALGAIYAPPDAEEGEL
jgi:hypothetical protein